MVTLKEELLAEGELRGRTKTVEGFLKAGGSWETIERATGLDETAYRALEEQGCLEDGAIWDWTENHDRLFRSAFSRPAEAVALLRPRLPEDIREALDWSTLEEAYRVFFNDRLQRSEAELLFRVEPAGDPQPAHLYRPHYILLEHESSPDPLTPLRMMQYCGQICANPPLRNASEPKSAKLPKVLAVVFYLGREKWAHSSVAEDLFPEPLGPWPKDPCHFGYRVLDETTRPPEQREAGPWGRVALAVMRAAACPADREVELRRAAELAEPLCEDDDTWPLSLFMTYLVDKHDEKYAEPFRQAAERYAPWIRDGKAALDASWLGHGRAAGEARKRAEGYAEGRAEMVEGFLKAGVSWAVVERASGLDEAAFRALKEQVASRS